jgi:hypothetical protein
MTVEVKSLPETSNMLPDFPDWITPTDLSKNRQDVLLRWKTIERIFVEQSDYEIIDEEWTNALLLSAITGTIKDSCFLDKLHKELKTDDFMYPSSPLDSEEEIRVLSSYCLSLLTDSRYFDDEYASQLTTKILSASFNGLRTFKGGISLYDTVLRNSFNYCRKLREKPSLYWSSQTGHF